MCAQYGLDTEASVTGERFAGYLQENPLVPEPRTVVHRLPSLVAFLKSRSGYTLGALPDFEAREAGDLNLLTGAGGHLGDQFRDRFVRILHEGLGQQDVLLEELL